MVRQRTPKRDTSDLTGMRTGVYLRVSRADKEDKKQLDAERSTSTQRRIFDEWAGRAGVLLADEYPDPDMSASRFAVKKNRPEFERMVADVKAGKLDILWFWEISRQQRRLDVFADLRNLCREHAVLWVIRDRVADPSNSSDMLSLGIQSMIAEDESEKLSVRVFDGKESSAMKGKRAGKFPYGYRRGKWDPVTETFGPDEPDVFDADGQPGQDSPAAIVREIFDRLLRGDSITSLRRDLNDRGVRTRTGAMWANSSVRYVAMNPAYAGMRVRHIGEGGALSQRARAIIPGVETKWPLLIDPDTFWAVYRRLADPARTTTKPDRPGGRLLSAVAGCGMCPGKLTVRKNGAGTFSYICRERGCAGIYCSDLDEFVTAVMIRWLSDSRTAEQLASEGDTSAAAQARADLDQAEAELAEWLDDARKGRISLAMARAAEEGLNGRIADARQRIQDAEVPLLLRDNIGPGAERGWAALTVPQRRQIIGEVADVRLLRVGRHGSRRVPAADRVSWRWLIGPATEEFGGGDAEQRIRSAEAARMAERREKVAHLRAEGLTVREIADEFGMSYHTVKKDLAAGRKEAPDDK